MLRLGSLTLVALLACEGPTDALDPTPVSGVFVVQKIELAGAYDTIWAQYMLQDVIQESVSGRLLIAVASTSSSQVLQLASGHSTCLNCQTFRWDPEWSDVVWQGAESVPTLPQPLVTTDDGILIGPLHDVRLEVRRSVDGITGTLSGVEILRDLAARPLVCLGSRYCRPPPYSRNMAEAFYHFDMEIDVDRDGDGLEHLRDDDGDRFIDACFDGDGELLLPVDMSDSSSCMRDPRMADGFSFVMKLSATPVQIVE